MDFCFPQINKLLAVLGTAPLTTLNLGNLGINLGGWDSRPKSSPLYLTNMTHLQHLTIKGSPIIETCQAPNLKPYYYASMSINSLTLSKLHTVTYIRTGWLTVLDDIPPTTLSIIQHFTLGHVSITTKRFTPDIIRTFTASFRHLTSLQSFHLKPYHPFPTPHLTYLVYPLKDPTTIREVLRNLPGVRNAVLYVAEGYTDGMITDKVKPVIEEAKERGVKVQRIAEAYHPE
ncbi:hypothetical protein HDV00_008982 [Rhizophlyctis rosea]|nr:hypothetical protein HDV00_008982 [Rhizophlyctis rosea]